MTRFLTGILLMILGIWAVAAFSHMLPDEIKMFHIVLSFFCVVCFLFVSGWHGADAGDSLFVSAIFAGFMWGSWSLIGKPIWVPFAVFGGILLATWVGYFIWAYYFYRYRSDAMWIGVDTPELGTVMVPRAGKTNHEISRDARRLAKHV